MEEDSGSIDNDDDECVHGIAIWCCNKLQQ
jgi:hypothetical protein